MAQDKVPTRVERPTGARVEEVPAGGSARDAAHRSAGHAAAGAPSAASAPSGDGAGSDSAGVPAGEPHGAAAPAAPAPTQDGPHGDYLARAGSWLAETFPNSRHAVIGGLCGLVVALLIFAIGLPRTLLIALLVTCGVACGQYLDGDPKIARAIQNLLKNR